MAAIINVSWPLVQLAGGSVICDMNTPIGRMIISRHDIGWSKTCLGKDTPHAHAQARANTISHEFPSVNIESPIVAHGLTMAQMEGTSPRLLKFNQFLCNSHATKASDYPQLAICEILLAGAATIKDAPLQVLWVPEWFLGARCLAGCSHIMHSSASPT